MKRTVAIFTAMIFGLLNAEDGVPEGFEVQVLEPTGGKILRPKGWFYAEGHRERSWMWTISKEDSGDGKGSYETGVRIQAFVGVEDITGKSPEAFVRGFAAAKREAADQVHKECEPVDQGLFTRACLEVTEGEYRILYSVFWGNGLDLAIISIAGAKTDDWEANAKFFDAMSAFELIDMKRFPADGD
jgi:hypothetical protein